MRSTRISKSIDLSVHPISIFCLLLSVVSNSPLLFLNCVDGSAAIHAAVYWDPECHPSRLSISGRSHPSITSRSNPVQNPSSSIPPPPILLKYHSLPRSHPTPRSPNRQESSCISPVLLPFNLILCVLMLMADHPKMAIKPPQILNKFLSLCPLRLLKNPATNLRRRRRHNNQL